MSVRFSRLRASERGVFNTHRLVAHRQKPVKGYFSVCAQKYSATLVSAVFGKVLEL